jgi:ribonuclease Z
MRLTFNPQLVNPPFGDPGLYVDFVFETRALLFDLGDLAALAPRKLLRISHVFVSHTHIDHFYGFDRLLRVCLGRHPGVTLYGPPGFAAQVGHKLAAYTWNLVQNYETDFVVDAWDFGLEGRLAGTRYRCHARFEAEPLGSRDAPGGVVLDEPALRVRACALEHRTASIGYALEEKAHLHVMKDKVGQLGVPTGPWLTELKRAVHAGTPPDTPIVIAWHDGNGAQERVCRVGELAAHLLVAAPGEKICYVTDVAYSEANGRRITALACGADRLFIECVFLDEDRDHGARKHHLTARQAGTLARLAHARSAVPFHFSPRYTDREDALRAELAAAFAGDAVAASVEP